MSFPRTSRAPVTDRPPRAGRSAVGVMVVLVAQLMLAMDTTIVNVALPQIATDLGFSPAALSWVLNAYTLAFGGLLLLGGRLGDTYGRLRTLQFGLLVFTLASLAGGFAQEPAVLISARTVQGVGAALAAPGILALLTTSAPDEAGRHRALALFSAVSIGGGTLGLVLGGLVTQYGSWRWTMFVNVVISLVVLLLARRFVTETPRRPGRFDLVGAGSATGAAVAIVWALIGAPDHGWTDARTIIGFAAGTALLGVLAITERRVTHPVLRPALLRSRRRLVGLAVTALVFGSQIGVFFLVVQYVQRVLTFGPLAAGVAFLPMTLGIFAMSRITPRLVARVGQIPLLVVGTLGLTLSYGWLSTIDATGTYLTTVFGPLLLNGISAGLTFMPGASLVVGDVEPEHAGSASGLLQTIQQLGGAVGLAVIVTVYAVGAVPGAFVPGVRAAFLTSAGFTLAASLLAGAAGRARNNRQTSTP